MRASVMDEIERDLIDHPPCTLHACFHFRANGRISKCQAAVRKIYIYSVFTNIHLKCGRQTYKENRLDVITCCS
ncbi:hypothetical protein Naga_101628g1 [Nannochloropsis gaditana]|uniref:Uncharacterized protein n=1 Tax=Nannochloropsis gaditana TaxID=72520 RepID=W7TTW8_9STRA|nr:hypothetical protein Naga_101628g1 [Nannochloropsis gaditana]